MKKTTKNKTLKLGRQTVRGLTLEGAELAKANGGREPWYTFTTSIWSEAHCTE